MRALILGGGVVGTSIAYRLASRGADVTVIERSGIACAASGKSGGFLAMDWCDGTPLMHLARRSFDLHAELAENLGGDWGYRRLTTYGGTVGRSSPRASRYPLPEWTSSDVRINGRLGSASTTAQVHPAAFTTGMMRAAQKRGAELRLARVTGLLRRGGDVVGVDLDGETLEGDAIVVAMGPWSVLATQWLSLPPVFGMKGHSLVLETGAAMPPEALFLEYEENAGSTLSPEIFPRADGDNLRVCDIERHSPPGRSQFRRPGRWCNRPAESTLQSDIASAGRLSCSREPSLLPPDDPGRAAVDRRHPGRSRGLRRHRP